jgi:hypothetical protein
VVDLKNLRAAADTLYSFPLGFHAHLMMLLSSCTLFVLSTVARGALYSSKDPLVDKVIPYDKIVSRFP